MATQSLNNVQINCCAVNAESKYLNTLNKFTILQWNIRGIGDLQQPLKTPKTESIMTILFDIQPDVICLQEGRIHYTWRDTKLTNHKNNNNDNKINPPTLYGYFNNIGNNSLYDVYHKNIIYIKQKYPFVEKIHIPYRSN